MLNKISTNLWFNTEAEEAAKFYVSTFPNSRIGRTTFYGKESHQRMVMTVEFELEGQQFVALNGGSKYKFTEAISFIISCETQEELDYYWEKLSEGGDEKSQVCGWLKDKYGVSWQIVPANLSKMVSDPDSEKSERVMKAMLQMKKINMNVLEEVYKG